MIPDTRTIFLFNLIWSFLIGTLLSFSPPNQSTTPGVIWKIDELWDGDKDSSFAGFPGQQSDTGDGSQSEALTVGQRQMTNSNLVDLLVTEEGMFEANPAVPQPASSNHTNNNTEAYDELDNEYNKHLICSLAPDSGAPCLGREGAALRYYYSTTAGVCRDFMFEGCQGNANNFKTMGECTEYCSGITSIPIGADYNYNDDYYDEDTTSQNAGEMNENHKSNEGSYSNGSEQEQEVVGKQDDLEDDDVLDDESEQISTKVIDANHRSKYQEQIHPINSNSVRSSSDQSAASKFAAPSQDSESHPVLNGGGDKATGICFSIFGILLSTVTSLIWWLCLVVGV